MVTFEEERRLAPWEKLTAGIGSGLVARIFVSPLDIWKIRCQLHQIRHHKDDPHQTSQQVDGSSPRASSSTASRKLVVEKKKTHRFSTRSTSLLSIYREEGIISFWRGNIAASLLWSTYCGVQFYVYHELNETFPKKAATTPLSSFSSKHSSPDFNNNNNSKSSANNESSTFDFRYAIHASIAGFLATCISYPFDILRTRFAGQGYPPLYSNYSTLLDSLVNKEPGGYRNMYKGLGPALFQIIPYVSIKFQIYESLQHNFADCFDQQNIPDRRSNQKHSDRKNLQQTIRRSNTSTQSGQQSNHHGGFLSTPTPKILRALFFGSISAFLSKLTVYPLDTVKKRLQTQGLARSSYYGVTLSRYDSKSWIKALFEVSRDEGILTLYNGLTPALIKAVPSSAITLCTYELFSDYLRDLS
eukprot:g2148.t1